MDNENQLTYYCILISFILGILISLQGCSAILGVKEYRSGDTVIKFVTGADISLGANGIDTVDNNRGINKNNKN